MGILEETDMYECGVYAEAAKELAKRAKKPGDSGMPPNERILERYDDRGM
jgi:hypothetical protein